MKFPTTISAIAPTGRRSPRGVTLVELLVVVALAALLMAGMISGLGAVTNAKVRGASTLIAGSVRTAFSRASSSSKTMRLVFDFDHNTVRLQQASRSILIRRDDEVGDISRGENKIAKQAQEQAQRVIHLPGKGPPRFVPVPSMGVDGIGSAQGRPLGSGVEFKSIEVSHQEEPVTHGVAYLYFWPGGQTERASIQIGRKGDEDDDSYISILVSPLTGRVKIMPGAVSMEKSREDTKREDNRL